MFKWNKLLEMIYLLQFTTNIQKFHCQPQRTLQFVCEDRRCVRLSRSSRFFMLAAASKMRASKRLACRPFFCKLRSSCDPINKSLTELGPDIFVANEEIYVGNHPELDICSF